MKVTQRDGVRILAKLGGGGKISREDFEKVGLLGVANASLRAWMVKHGDAAWTETIARAAFFELVNKTLTLGEPPEFAAIRAEYEQRNRLF